MSASQLSGTRAVPANHPVAPPDSDIARFGVEFRAGRRTSEQATREYLARIEQLDGKLGAYQHVAAESALATARAMDALRQAGTDLGPLMGLPIAVKDIFVIDGFPMPRAGSKLDLSDLCGSKQGAFISALRRAGCVILGTTKAVEFCLGITGVSSPLGTPWNPNDMSQQRLPGGSSSGSGVAMAAGLCALAIGSDTGGSVRVPAAFNGVFGLKTTFGLWPTEGAVPLDPRLDSIGLLTRSAVDAAIAYQAINAQLTGHSASESIEPADLASLNLGLPSNYFFESLDADVETAVEQANQMLRGEGVRFDAVAVPEAPEREDYFPVALPASVVSLLGRERFEANRAVIDSVIEKRVASGLGVKASDYLALEALRLRSQISAQARFDGFDAWASPTTASAAPALSDLDDPANAMRLALGMTRNTQPANYLGQCSVSLPLPRGEGELPIGYQLMCPAGEDARVLSLAMAIEAALHKSVTA